MTIITKLEGLLPEGGPVTKTDKIIAEAVEALRDIDEWGARSLTKERLRYFAACAASFLAGIAAAVIVGAVV